MLDLTFYRIDCGYSLYKTKYGEFRILAPSKELKYRAELIYQEKLIEASTLMSEDEIIDILIELDLWSHEDETELITLDEEIEQLQINIFEDFWKNTNNLRLQLNNRKERRINLIQKKNAFNHYSQEGYAIFSKSQYILENTVYLNGYPYKFDKLSLHHIFNIVNSNRILDEEIRQLSRSEPWLSVKENRKQTIFMEESDDQRRLLMYDMLYSSIKENPECPAQEIIDDNDAFDGWLASKRRESKRKKHQEHVERKLGKNKNKQELFLPATSIEEARQIDALNSKESAINKQRRLMAIDKKGEVQIQHMPDVMDKIRMELAQKAN